MHLSRRYESAPKLKPHHVNRTCSLLINANNALQNFNTFIIPYIFSTTIVFSEYRNITYCFLI